MAKRLVQKSDPVKVEKAAKLAALLEKLRGYHSDMSDAFSTAKSHMEAELQYTTILFSQGDYEDKYEEYKTKWLEAYSTCYSNSDTTIANLATKIEEVAAAQEQCARESTWWEWEEV